MIVNDINVTVNGLSDITPHEVENYIAYIEGQTHEKLDRLSITGTDDGRVTRAPHHGLPGRHHGSLEQCKAGRRA